MSSQLPAFRLVALFSAFLIASVFLVNQEGRTQSAGQSQSLIGSSNQQKPALVAGFSCLRSLELAEPGRMAWAFG